MNDFWNIVILDNPLKSYIIVAATILFVVALKRYLSHLIARLIFRFIQRIGTGLDRSAFLDLVVGPIGTFLVILVTVTSIEKLHFPRQAIFDIYEVTSKTMMHGLASIILILTFIWLLSRLVDFIATVLRTKARKSGGPRDHQVIGFIRDFLKAILGIIGLLMILDEVFLVNVSSILTSLGLAGAAIALAAKESIENLIASFVIFFDKPFKAGDYLKVNAISGTVEKIGLRSTRIRTDQKTYVTVPNKQMVDSVVDNLTLRTQRKGELRLELSLSTSAVLLDELITGIREILATPAIGNGNVFLSDITGSAFLVNVEYFTAPSAIEVFNATKQQVNLEVLRLMEKLKISITGSSTTVTLTPGSQGPEASPTTAPPTAGPQTAALPTEPPPPAASKVAPSTPTKKT